MTVLAPTPSMSAPARVVVVQFIGVLLRPDEPRAASSQNAPKNPYEPFILYIVRSRQIQFSLLRDAARRQAPGPPPHISPAGWVSSELPVVGFAMQYP